METFFEVAEEKEEQCADLENIVKICVGYIKKYQIDQDDLKTASELNW
jgi:hypothetical protein